MLHTSYFSMHKEGIFATKNVSLHLSSICFIRVKQNKIAVTR